MSLAGELIEPDVTRLRLSSWQGRLAGYEVSAYVLRGILIDTGFRRAGRELEGVLEVVRPRGAIVTHWHEDHAGNVPALADRGLPMLMHPRCEATLRARPAIRAYRHVVWGQTRRLVAPLRELDPAPLEVLAMPGHSADHLGVWDAERRILVSGDLFLGVKVRVAHRSESPRLLLRSLRAAAALEPRLLLDAHRGPVAHATRQLRAKIAWLDDTIGAIVEGQARGDSPRSIARQVLGREAAVGWFSGGEYSKLAFVRAALEER
jgi:glyoxylase-like metal-dependent hydrolase (beta-lactamase superfamily II)